MIVKLDHLGPGVLIDSQDDLLQKLLRDRKAFDGICECQTDRFEGFKPIGRWVLIKSFNPLDPILGSPSLVRSLLVRRLRIRIAIGRIIGEP